MINDIKRGRLKARDVCHTTLTYARYANALGI